ncbi:transposase [Sorangium sp. So ce1128]
MIPAWLPRRVHPGLLQERRPHPPSSRGTVASRPAFALDRIELLPDGCIAYLLKTPRRGRTHRVMSPMEFMARLAALIPPPKVPLVRYHGVFAPRSSWRSLVTPKPPARAAKSEPCAGHAPLPAAPAPAPASPAPASPCAPPALSARSLAHAEPTVSARGAGPATGRAGV